jgi:DNA-binding transcriptional MerR regulator
LTLKHRKEWVWMKSYTLPEFAKRMGVSPKVIKQWEKDFETYISIPRTKQGARIYSEAEENFFQNIKALYEKKLKKHEIINYLKSQNTPVASTHVSQEENAVEQMIVINEEMSDDHSANKDLQETSLHLKEELHEEYDIVKEEASQVSEYLHSMSDLKKSCMQKISDQNEATAHSIEQIKEETEQHVQVFQKQIDDFQNTNIKTLEELEETLSQEALLEETLLEEILLEEETLQEEKEHDLLTLEHERKLYEQKIMERERAFRKLVLAFRESTPTAEMKKTKKWWKFWATIK